MTSTITEPLKVLKLSTNPLENEKTKLVTQLGKKIESEKYDDWRSDLLRDGYVVIKNAIPKKDAEDYQKRIFEWVKAFGADELNFEDRSTWKIENLPQFSNIGSFSKYSVPHEKFFWDLRQEPGFKDKFAKFWGTDELLVSFDAINVSFPGIKKEDLRTLPWPHVDQSPYRSGLSCLQGIAQLSEAGPKDGSLIVYKGSHKLVEDYFKNVLKEENWQSRDIHLLQEGDLDWFEARGSTRVKIEAEPGDLILWDSRTIHWGAQPDEDSDVIRTIAYISYSPAEFATDESLTKKKEVFEKWAGTSHWAHDNINPRYDKAQLPDGKLDPRDIGEPREKPELTDSLLKLAGAKRY